ncbi:hypothetical protein F2P81_017474 [Scophthalmus maximus]|uniref:Uncharacterized protein n=1 Tax=Scophthalmus maximus TaxID=52904 RepID=A0A6A4S8Y0_SCOMX|nr:hypothetical protein F2P81_017474 [Scophthalmus maximus]
MRGGSPDRLGTKNARGPRSVVRQLRNDLRVKGDGFAYHHNDFDGARLPLWPLSVIFPTVTDTFIFQSKPVLCSVGGLNLALADLNLFTTLVRTERTFDFRYRHEQKKQRKPEAQFGPMCERNKHMYKAGDSAADSIVDGSQEKSNKTQQAVNVDCGSRLKLSHVETHNDDRHHPGPHGIRCGAAQRRECSGDNEQFVFKRRRQ